MRGEERSVCDWRDEESVRCCQVATGRRGE
jgi:hypothetical protein